MKQKQNADKKADCGREIIACGLDGRATPNLVFEIIIYPKHAEYEKERRYDIKHRANHRPTANDNEYAADKLDNPQGDALCHKVHNPKYN